MKAMIFAAGLGTRLRPLTNHKPKALVEIKGTPLLELVIRRLIHFGFDDIIINVHHFADQIIAFVKLKNKFGVKIQISDERHQLLETGGGLKYAQSFFQDSQAFLVCNADIISDLDLKLMYDQHLVNDALATLAVRHRSTSRYLIFDKETQVLQGWLNTKNGDMKMRRHGADALQLLAFSGIHIISPSIFDFMPNEEKFSIIDVYLKAAKTEKIIAYRHDDSFWLDVGKPESLALAENYMESQELNK